MRKTARLLAAAGMLVAFPAMGAAQDADAIIEQSIKALGGRAAHAKLTSRTATGTITLSTPAGDITGTIEAVSAAPNKSRTLIKADLSALGAGELVLDQRFDGYNGYVLDSLQGNREMPESQLENLRNGRFPHPFLHYKDLGSTAKVSGKEAAGAGEAFVVVMDPTSGPVTTYYIDAKTYLPIKLKVNVEVPQLGTTVEQTTEFLDYKAVDGVQVPFRIRSSSSVQNVTITVDKVEHNTKVDEALFVKPPGR